MRILAVGDDENLGNAAQLAQSIARSGQACVRPVGALGGEAHRGDEALPSVALGHARQDPGHGPRQFSSTGL